MCGVFLLRKRRLLDVVGFHMLSLALPVLVQSSAVKKMATREEGRPGMWGVRPTEDAEDDVCIAG
jgi:hypothetical protein